MVTYNMNDGAAPSGGVGPTEAAAAADVDDAQERQEALLQRVDTNVADLVDNFAQLINLAKVSAETLHNERESLQMSNHAKRIVDAASSLQEVASELKQNAILSGSGTMNVENVDARVAEFDRLAEDTDRLLERIHEQATASLKELETHYYSSVVRKDAGAGDATDK